MSLSDIVAKAQNLGLASLKLPELREVATGLGLRRVTGVRKGDLIAAIESAGGIDKINIPSGGGTLVTSSDRSSQRNGTYEYEEQSRSSSSHQDSSENNEGAEAGDAFSQDSRFSDHEKRRETRAQLRRQRRQRAKMNAQNSGQPSQNNEQSDKPDKEESYSFPSEERNNRRPRPQEQDSENRERGREESDYDQGDRRGRRNRRDRRGRNDNRDNRNGRDRDNSDSRRDNRENGANSHQVPADQLTPIAGILDFADANTAFIRTTGYHPGATDIYVPVNMARKHGMRHGDYIVGAIRQRPNSNQNNNNRGRQRQKYSPLYSVDTVNGLTPEEANQRPQFHKLTPLYPNQRLRLETQPKVLTTRVIDLIMPIGKGQRALIVSPPKAGKTTILQDIANAITVNNPECYLMVVLVDERPEEVTDMQRSVKGEVIASTFDRPPSEHTNVAELAIERAKRLVEQGTDVIVLLDSITRLGRAYNNSSPASGRILSGGVDSNALYPPKRFLGAARNIENGGSLTIIATAMVETGSAGDTVIFEEFKGTGNAELKLDRKIAERRVFPAVDVNPSGTRKDELLLNPDEAKVMHKLRRILSALDNQDAIDLLIKQLRKTKNNMEFLMQVASSGPLIDDAEDGE